MPILRVVSSKTIGLSTIRQLKLVGKTIGYDDPRKIWIETSGGLTQQDVAFVEVKVKESDFNHPKFQEFCDQIAVLLRGILEQSVEVITPAVVPMRPMSWKPTEEGAEIYGE